MDHTSRVDVDQWTKQQKGFALSGKIMLSAIVILFTVIIFMLLLHIYARWYLLTVRRREIRRRRSRHRHRHVFVYNDIHGSPVLAVGTVNSGLDASVLGSLPVFVYSSKTHQDVLECAVCLSEFEENEKGRLLPKCNHSFHIECIDMWFHSHSTCPLCRAPVEATGTQTPTIENNGSDVVLTIVEFENPESVSSSGTDHVCQQQCTEDNNGASTSLGSRRKGIDLTGVSIEVPRRNELDSESRLSSPASQGFKSPGGRLLSLKRLLSMNRLIGHQATTSGTAGVVESDSEQARDESTQGQTRPHTPKPQSISES